MHEQHHYIETDDHFDTGTIAHLVVGNKGRVLDGRRTPGYIESFDEESAMFIWRITAFEDKGKCWEIPAEEISSYQFRKGSALLTQSKVDQIEKHCEILNKKLCIPKREDMLAETEASILEQEHTAWKWILQNSHFYKSGKTLDFHAYEGEPLLFADLEAYLRELGFDVLERTTAEQYLLNPYSGEWIKGMKITMAEMGLISYYGANTRKKETFSGIGTKELRRNYIIARIAFVRSFFKLYGLAEVPLYRGMSSTIDFYATPHTLISTTFSFDTAMSFADLSADSTARSAYCVKFTCPVNCLFMTFFETKQFSKQYKEQEAIIFYNGQIQF